MEQAGINWLAYGFESGSKKVLQGVRKSYSPDRLADSVRKTYNEGIHIISNFMFGLPEDNLQTMQETYDLAVKLKCEYVNFYTTMAYPGSQLYSIACREGRDLPSDWSAYSQLGFSTHPLSTKYLTAAQVLEFRDRAFNSYYSDQTYLNMIKEKFGNSATEHIRAMLACPLKRSLILNDDKNN